MANLGYHQDKTVYKLVQSIINMSKKQLFHNHRPVNDQICYKITDYSTVKYVNITDNSTITFCWNNFQNELIELMDFQLIISSTHCTDSILMPFLVYTAPYSLNRTK